MIKNLISSRFISGISFYSFLPFYSLYLFNIKDLSDSRTATVIFIFLFISRGCSLFTHYIIDYLGYKKTLISSYFIASTSIISINYTYDFHLLLLVSSIIGASFSIANTSTSLFISENENHIIRVKNFSLLNVVINISSALGGIIGEWSYHSFHSGTIIIPSILMFIAFLYSFTLKKSETYRIKSKDVIIPSSTKIEWVVFILYSSTSFFILGLFLRNLAYYFEINKLNKYNYISVSYLFTLNAALIISTQVKVTHFLSKKNLKFQDKIYKSSLILVSAPLLFFDFHSAINMYILVFLFTISEIIWSPYNNSIAIEKAPFTNKKISLSICIFLWGTAESLGAYIGIIANKIQFHLIIPLTVTLMLIMLFSIEHLLKKRKN